MPASRNITIPQGNVFIHAGPTPEQLKTLESVFDLPDNTYPPLYTREQIQAKCAVSGVVICLALLENKTIVGFSVLSPPQRHIPVGQVQKPHDSGTLRC